ncbi:MULTISPECIES: hypothetical protein [Delftia]|uniref:hypothetical protein n=1 Tax=Delftia TaxID=80865 RepID=UPI00092C6461|nr:MULTISPECIES: hypothetical protein [unclassified Delftia]OJX21457.1 MAG: hypothetical protein BGO79_24355 [Delftia sp. 67-8]WON88062.1 hypothetical protein OK021_25520 [Delftia sp. UGAL515B_04]
MSLDAVISADLVKTRADIAALSSAVAATRSEVAGLTIQMSNGSAIKSIQRGIIIVAPIEKSIGRTIAVAAVNPSKSQLNLLGICGYGYSSTSIAGCFNGRIQLISSTSLEVRFGSYAWTGETTELSCSWELVEYK